MTEGRAIVRQDAVNVSEGEGADLASSVSRAVSVRIRQRRTRLGVSQSALAEAAGVSSELVSRIERGRCLPSVPTLVAFSTILRTTPDALLGFEAPVGDPDVRSMLDALYALGPNERAEVLRIAQALARYHSEAPPPPPAPRERARRESGIRPVRREE